MQLACQAIAKTLLKASDDIDGRPLHGVKSIEELDFVNGEMICREDPTRRVGLIQAMQAGGLDVVPRRGCRRRPDFVRADRDLSW